MHRFLRGRAISDCLCIEKENVRSKPTAVPYYSFTVLNTKIYPRTAHPHKKAYLKRQAKQIHKEIPSAHLQKAGAKQIHKEIPSTHPQKAGAKQIHR